MIIEKIELSNFRNYEKLSLDLSSGTNILYGDNAQGKTNILEAIYIGSTTKSHRGSKDKEVIKFNEKEAHIKLIIKKENVPYRIDMHLKKNKPKGVAVNGITIKKASELFGIVNIIFFSPEDLYIIKSGPSKRRRFMDMELCQLDKIYVYNLINYNKVLNQRNALLKNMYFREDFTDTLDILDRQLSIYGEKVIERRNRFIDEINEPVLKIHEKLTGGKEKLKLKYEPNTDQKSLYESLFRNRERDIKFKTTTTGPHRDDFGFYNDEINIRTYGSQGQQRTAALSLKLAEIELVKSIINDVPILLLDDVLSELDGERQNHLLNSLNEIQTIITCTGLDEFVENRFSIDKVYKVSDGKIYV